MVVGQQSPGKKAETTSELETKQGDLKHNKKKKKKKKSICQ